MPGQLFVNLLILLFSDFFLLRFVGRIPQGYGKAALRNETLLLFSYWKGAVKRWG